MEYAEIVSRALPPEERQEFGAALAVKLNLRPDFDAEMTSNSANHCLRRALDGLPNEES
jgi:hypothetical protein